MDCANPLFIDEVFYFIVKRNNMIKKYSKTNTVMNKKKIAIDKFFKYVKFFSKFNQFACIKIRLFIQKKLYHIKIKNHLKFNLFFCKIIDILPNKVSMLFIIKLFFFQYKKFLYMW